MEIFIVEDDRTLGAGMAFTLEREGYQIKTMGTCREVRAALQEKIPDLVLLDWNLPDGDGLKLCKEIREKTDMPILMITARDMEIDQVMCLEQGADDYISKPFSLAVLKARILALLRRRGGQSLSKRVLSSGTIYLNEKEMKAFKEDRDMELSLTEFRLLRLFLEHKIKYFLKSRSYSRFGTAEAYLSKKIR